MQRRLGSLWGSCTNDTRVLFLLFDIFLQHDEWQGQLLEQEEEEKRLLRLQEEREHRLKKEGWVSLGMVQVNDVANAQVCQL